MLPTIALTVGDPAGIGPEIVGKAVADPGVRDVCVPVVYGPDGTEQFTPGAPSDRTGSAAYEVIVRAVRDAATGRVDAIATAPVSKEAFALAGLPWRGHTDLLAHLTGSPFVAMMFDSPVLRVVLATIHVALRDVPDLITRERMERTIRLTASEMPRFGIETPRIAVAALNPHAGERGLMGREDDEEIAPAVVACRQDGLQVTGPWPGDTVFTRAARGEFDVVVACYHDQGLIPVKLAAFGESVNVTLGLPLIRTSVDHGTAFDIAGKGVADQGSMIRAVRLAARLAVQARRSANRDSSSP